MEIDPQIIQDLMRDVRTKSEIAKGEITDLVKACKKDLEMTGVYISDLLDPLAKQAIKLYCKANYGYDEESEKLRTAYTALRDSMALSGDYKKVGETDG